MGSAAETHTVAPDTVDGATVPDTMLTDTMLTDTMLTDTMLTETDRAFVRSTAVGVFVGMVGMFAFVAIACALVAADMGRAFALALAGFSALVTGGFFGGVVFASRFLIRQENEEAAHRAYVRAA